MSAEEEVGNLETLAPGEFPNNFFVFPFSLLCGVATH